MTARTLPPGAVAVMAAVLLLAGSARGAEPGPVQPAPKPSPLAECDNPLRLLRIDPARPDGVTLGVEYLACAGSVVGEGAAMDLLATVVPSGSLMPIIDARLKALKARLDIGHDDARSLAAVGFYSLLMDTEAETIWGERYLGEAIAIDPTLPDVWYLRGRFADRLAHLEDARTSYERQIREHPGTPATRLAINELGVVLVALKAPSADLQAALAALDVELAKTPEESAMHDTRGRLLLSLGRRGDGLAALRRALELSPSPALSQEIDQLASTPPVPTGPPSPK